MHISDRNAEMMAQSAARAKALLETDRQIATAVASAEDRAFIQARSHSSIEHMEAVFTRFADRPCLGTRQGPGFATQTYAQIWHRSRSLAGALQARQLLAPHGAVGLYGFGSADWMVAHLAAHVLCATSVPLRTGLSADDLAFIINQAELTCIVASAELLPRLAAVLPQCPRLRGVVAMDGASEASLPLTTVNMASLEAEGPVAELVKADGPERLMAILYTSGSTGRPKGAMYPERLYERHVNGGFADSVPRMPSVGLGYLPLNHLAGLTMVLQTLNGGGVTQFVQKSDMSTLFDDVRVARPTFLFFVPRVADMIYQAFISECVRRGDADDPAIRTAVMEHMRTTFLGDRLLYAVAGTAPTAPEVMDFLQRCFAIPVFNGYGATENASVTFEDHITRNYITDYKLVDVPELGYRTTDKPYPRGELRIQSSMMIPGYFKNPEATAGLYDAQGYQKTGDIVEERGPDHVVWIDRKHNVLKLSQGEFVQVSHLENLYAAQSPFIDQVYIYGTSQRSYLLAVLVPNLPNVHARLGDCDEGAVKNLLRQELDRVARAAQVQTFEVPRDFLVQAEPFTKENGLLTESSKPARPQLKAAFGPRLEALYEAGEERGRAALRQLRDRTDLSVRDKVVACVTAVLGLAGLEADTRQVSFISMGGDSLTAVQLSETLRQVCGAAPPVGLLLDSNTPLAALVAAVERLQGASGSPRLDFAAIHGADATVAKASDLRLERFIPAAAPGQAALPEPSPRAKNVLLTGANGFLGRFILLELLREAQAQGGTVTALVRGKDDAAAAQRVREAFAESGPEVAARLTKLQDHLQVVAGDLMLPRLGLSEATYDALCDSVDTVLHNGALVNHALTYPQLFEPNVLGTVELIRLCLRRRKKAITFVSTVGVPAGADHTVTEEETGSALWQQRPIDSGYASGYGTSKWAAEVLLEQLAQQHGIPVNVVRSGMIMAHTRLRGQVNTTDFVTRLLTGLIHTGVRPPSFYGRAGRHHFDGIPVDVVAASVAAIALEERTGHQLFHAINTHDDAFSLDSFADAIGTAGYSLHTAHSYSSWYKEFSAGLETLPRAVRDTTPYPILFQWQAPTDSLGDTSMTNARFRARVQRLTRYPDIPHLDEGFLHTTLKHMVARDLIPEAAEAEGQEGQEARGPRAAQGAVESPRAV